MPTYIVQEVHTHEVEAASKEQAILALQDWRRHNGEISYGWKPNKHILNSVKRINFKYLTSIKA